MENKDITWNGKRLGSLNTGSLIEIIAALIPLRKRVLDLEYEVAKLNLDKVIGLKESNAENL